MHDVLFDTAFPGGNAVLDGIDGDTVRLHPDLRDTQGNWFYWSFRVRGAAGRDLTFQFTAQDPVGVRGPAVSLDEGLTWRWLGNATGRTDRFHYSFAADACSVRFSFGMNYVDADWQRFLRKIDGGPAVRRDSLCRSRKGRDVPRLHVGQLAKAPKHVVLLTARHHCCEMMENYAIEGVVAGVLADDETGRWYRDCVEVAIVPFMDRDGCEDGDQGKNRQPRDHNRDYAGESLYPETRALREFAPLWAQDGRLVMIDLHCPWIRGPFNEQLYQVGQESQAVWSEQQRFGAVLERVARGPLPYRQADDLPFGREWNVGSGYGDGMSSAKWFSSLPGTRLATSFELPYANCSGQEVNAHTARAFGRDLAEALRAYLAGRTES